MKSKIFNIGINDLPKNTLNLKSYNVWVAMLRRCYDKKYQEKYPTYTGCIVCEEWLYFSNFKKWFDGNYRFDLEEEGIKLELDKDLLSSEENKIYSPSTCVFIPYDINTFIRKRNSNNNSGYVGVSWDKETNKWRARINDFDTKRTINIGRYLDIEEAYEHYKHYLTLQLEKIKKYMISKRYNHVYIAKLEEKFKREGL